MKGMNIMKNNKNSNKNAPKRKTVKSKNIWEIAASIGVIAVVALVIVFGLNGGRKDKKMTEDNVKVLVEMENGEDFTLELYPEYAPQTVQNFVDLVTDGFYDGVGFHRVVEGFMAQGGDPEGTGIGGSGVTIPGEFAANGFSQNTLSHTRGVISMARSQDPDSASSQFFICYDDASFLDGQYAAFGHVTEGMEFVDIIAKEAKPIDDNGTIPKEEQPVIETIKIID